ncbi:MAG: VCBS domain-containing protein [Hyphomicrobiaceae bacterium]
MHGPGSGGTLTDSITVSSEDGTASQLITVTITGTNDGAVISGTATGNVTEDGTPTATGTLTVSDIDTGEAELQPSQQAHRARTATGRSGGRGCGRVDLHAEQWPCISAGLAWAATLTDSITVSSEDGTASQLITVTITGTNDGAVISGTATGNVTEDGTPTATGTLTVSDIDTGEAELQPVAAGTPGTNGYGTFAVTAAGVWTYTLNNGHASVQALPAGVTLTDSITVSSEDGTASQLITVTITGTNDGAVISGTATGNVTEDGTPTATGTLTVSDIDTGEAELQPVAAGTPGTNGYGTFAVTAAGVWTYTLNNGHASVQALPAGVTLTDSITVSSEDGTASQLITVTITGTNDGAAITGTASGGVTEDGTLIAMGTLSVADIDTGEAELAPVAAGTPGTNGYGTFAVTAAGVWTYTLDNGHASVQALPAGVTLTDSITVSSEDGTASQLITVTITGTNDAPTASALSVTSTEEPSPTTFEALTNGSFSTGNFNGWSVGITPSHAQGGRPYNIDSAGDGWEIRSGSGTALGSTFGNQLMAVNGFDGGVVSSGGSMLPEADLAFYLRQGFNLDGSEIGASLSFIYDIIGGPNFGQSNGGFPTEGRTFDVRILNTAGTVLDTVYSYSVAGTTVDGQPARSISLDLSPTIGTLPPGTYILEFHELIPQYYTGGAQFEIDNISLSLTRPRVTGTFTGDDIDTDDSAASLIYEILTQPTAGTVTNNGDGTFHFDPGSSYQHLLAGETDVVSFTYVSKDSHGVLSAPATVSITITGANDAATINGTASGASPRMGHRLLRAR